MADQTSDQTAQTAQTQTAKPAAKPKAPKIIQTVGKRKEATARATIREGRGVVRINRRPLEKIEPELARLKLLEPIKLAEDSAKNVDIDVIVKGGGYVAQAAAARQAIARGLVQWNRSSDLRNLFIAYDRSLLVYDPRQTEPHKFSRSSKGARRKKQLSRR